MFNFKTPGVYVVELPATGPIAGVGTSTAAFIGAALKGPINTPTKITSWTQFKDQFGEWINHPDFYLAYAVRGFFDNGGTVCYITRVGTAARALLDLDDRGAGKALRVEALTEGVVGNGITVEVQDAQIVATANNARIRKASAATLSSANNVVKLANIADAAKFKSGDIVLVGTERVEIDRIRQDELLLTSNLTTATGAGTVLIDNVINGQLAFRVENSAGLEIGSVINIDDGTNDEDLVVTGVQGERITVAAPGVANAPAGGYDLSVAGDVDVTSYEFNLIITPPLPALPETFSKLSMDPRHSRYFGKIAVSKYVTVGQPPAPSTEVPPDNRPAVVGATNLAGGANDNLATIAQVHYQNALAALVKVDDVNLISTPDKLGTSSGVQADVIAHCELMADRFAILDSPFGAPPFGAGSVLLHRAAVESQRGYAALYYPWMMINDPASRTGETKLVPPSGHLAGIFARTDTERGVHKAPANELIRGAVGLERIVDETEHGELNIEGVNVLRIFPGRARPTVWGARTTAPKDDTAWRYINVRRLFLFIEESIQEGLRWAVFEPNDTGLWKKIHRTLTEFLTRVWRSGALFGNTAAEAFYVKVDEELNPPSVRALGQVIIEIGIAPVRPAEFVIVQIGMWDGGSEVTEA
jgi:phage tail sheath protein FI